MNRVSEPMVEMGAVIEATGANGTAPFKIKGRHLQPIRYELPVASAQVKSAILLAGLQTPGKTTVVEPVLVRDHTERMMDYFLIKTTREPINSGYSISLYGDQVAESRDFIVPRVMPSPAFL